MAIGDADSVFCCFVFLSSWQFQRKADIFVHWSAHQSVHNVLSELVAVVAVDGVCQTDHHFKAIHVNVPIGVIGEQAERAMSVLFMRDTFIIYRAYLAEHGG